MLASLGSCRFMLVILRFDRFIGVTAVMLQWVCSSAQSAFRVLGHYRLIMSSLQKHRAVTELFGLCLEATVDVLAFACK